MSKKRGTKSRGLGSRGNGNRAAYAAGAKLAREADITSKRARIAVLRAAKGNTGAWASAAPRTAEMISSKLAARSTVEQSSALGEGRALLVQAPFARLLVGGYKVLEARAGPLPAGWAGKRVAIMQSSTRSSLASAGGAHAAEDKETKSQVVGSVIFSGSSPLQAADAAEVCLTAECMVVAMKKYRYGWRVAPGSAVKYSAPYSSKQAGYSRGAVTVAKLNQPLDARRVLRTTELYQSNVTRYYQRLKRPCMHELPFITAAIYNIPFPIHAEA